jgi:hypothetical protein
MKEIIHSVWIGNQISLLEQLSIKLFQMRGFDVCLWLYDECHGVPDNVIIKDASNIMPRKSLFKYEGMPDPNLPNGGIGSYSFWADQFQARLLYTEGGIYSQLDVMMLSDIEFPTDNLFTHDGNTAQACFMKMNKGSEVALALVNLLEKTVNSQTMPSLQWLDSMKCIDKIIKLYNLENCILQKEYFQNMIYHDAVAPDTSLIKLIHWCNASLKDNKNKVYKGSLYESLLRKVGCEEFSYITQKNIQVSAPNLPLDFYVKQIESGIMPISWYSTIAFKGLLSKLKRVVLK